MPFCPSCGAELKVGEEFCTNCGASTSRPVAPSVRAARPINPDRPKKGPKMIASIVIPLIVFATLFSAVPVVPGETANTVDFQLPSSGDLKPNSYVYASVFSPAGGDLYAVWNSSSDLTGSFFTPDAFNNFKNIISGNPSGEAVPLDVVTSAAGRLYLLSISTSTTAYFVLWNRHTTAVTYSGLTAWSFYSAPQCFVTLLNSLIGKQNCFTPSNLAVSTTGSPIQTGSSAQSSSSIQTQPLTGALVTPALSFNVTKMYVLAYNSSLDIYELNITATVTHSSVAKTLLYELFTLFNYGSPNIGDNSSASITTTAGNSYRVPTVNNNAVSLGPFDAFNLTEGMNFNIKVAFASPGLIVPAKLQFSLVCNPNPHGSSVCPKSVAGYAVSISPFPPPTYYIFLSAYYPVTAPGYKIQDFNTTLVATGSGTAYPAELQVFENPCPGNRYNDPANACNGGKVDPLNMLQAGPWWSDHFSKSLSGGELLPAGPVNYTLWFRFIWKCAAGVCNASGKVTGVSTDPSVRIVSGLGQLPVTFCVSPPWGACAYWGSYMTVTVLFPNQPSQLSLPNGYTLPFQVTYSLGG